MQEMRKDISQARLEEFRQESNATHIRAKTLRPGEFLPQKVRWAVLCRAKIKCENCGEKLPLEMHHRTYKRRSNGEELPIFGNETPAALLALCRQCHHQAHRDIYGKFWADPEEMEWQFAEQVFFVYPKELVNE